MRVLHLVTWLNPGGIEHWLVGFIKATMSKDSVMSVCCRSSYVGDLAERLVHCGVQVTSCTMMPGVMTYDRRLQAVIRDFKADLIHNHLGATSLLAVRAARRCKVPIITTFHSPQFAAQSHVAKQPLVRTMRKWYADRSVAYAIRHSNLVTGVSQGVLETIAPGKQDDKRFRVTYLGTPPRSQDHFEPFDIRASHGWPADSKLVVKLGRLAHEKDPIECIEVFKRVSQQCPDARLVFLGEGHLRSAIVNAAKAYDLSNLIALMGYRDDAPKLLSQATVLLHPSRYEGFGLSVVEAAMHGVPAVATDIPGLNEAIVDKQTGFLHPIGDRNSMAQSIVELLSDPTLYQRFSRQALEFASTRFDSSNCQARMLETYREVLA